MEFNFLCGYNNTVIYCKDHILTIVFPWKQHLNKHSSKQKTNISAFNNGLTVRCIDRDSRQKSLAMPVFMSLCSSDLKSVCNSKPIFFV